MLAQGREAEKAKQELAEVQDKLQQLEESYERLKRRLDDKDTQIHKLRAALQSAQGGAIKADGASSPCCTVDGPAHGTACTAVGQGCAAASGTAWGRGVYRRSRGRGGVGYREAYA